MEAEGLTIQVTGIRETLHEFQLDLESQLLLIIRFHVSGSCSLSGRHVSFGLTMEGEMMDDGLRSKLVCDKRMRDGVGSDGKQEPAGAAPAS